MQRRDAFISFSRGVTCTGIAHASREKDTKKCSCLICDSSCCRTSCVSVQLCTPKVLPNTETFLHSRVFFVTCVVPALCQIMYSLSVCSDGTTSAAPRSFRQNRPPARTLSLTDIPTGFHRMRAMLYARFNQLSTTLSTCICAISDRRRARKIV